MIEPSLPAWMKQSYFPTAGWFDSRAPRLLTQRTGDTSKSKISGMGSAAAYARQDVIDMESCFLADLCEVAIFAPSLGPQHHQTPQASPNITHYFFDWRVLILPARNRRSESNSARFTKPSASLRSAAVKRLPLSWRSSRSCSRV